MPFSSCWCGSTGYRTTIHRVQSEHSTTGQLLWLKTIPAEPHYHKIVIREQEKSCNRGLVYQRWRNKVLQSSSKICGTSKVTMKYGNLITPTSALFCYQERAYHRSEQHHRNEVCEVSSGRSACKEGHSLRLGTLAFCQV